MLFCPGGNLFFGTRNIRSLDRECLFNFGTGAELLKISPAVRFAASLVSHNRKHMLASEMQLLELAEYSTWICAPPARTGDHDIVVFAYVAKIYFELWAGIISLLLLRDLSAFHIVVRIFLHGLDLEKISSYRVTDVFSNELGVALLELDYISIYIILSFAGKIDHKISGHISLLIIV